MMDLRYSWQVKNKRINALMLFTLVILLGGTVNAQDYNRKIEWLNQARTITTIDGKEFNQPTFNKAAHSESKNLLPVYIEKIPVSIAGEVKAEILNPVFAPVTVDAKSVQDVPSEIEVTAALSVFKKSPRAHVEFIPLRKSLTGQVERLVSFTIRLKVQPVAAKRSGNSYAANSVLASGNWHKIAVSEEGIYKIDYNFLKNVLKIEPGNISFNRLAIFGNGGGMVPDENSADRPDDLLENPTLIVDNNGNNRFDQDDYLLFYGQMPDAWRYNASTQQFSHEKNLYSDKTYYFLTTDAGTGKRVQFGTNDGTPNKTITRFNDRVYRDSDEENFLKSGRTWVGDKMTSFNSIKNFSYNFPNIISGEPARFVSSIAAKTNFGSSTRVNVNGQTIITHSEPGINPNISYPPGALPYIFSTTISNPTEQFNVSYQFLPNADPSGTAATFIDYFEIHVMRGLTMASNAMTFRSIESVGPGSVSEFRLANANASIQIWDITDVGNIQRMNAVLTGQTLSFVTSTSQLKEFIAFTPSSGYSNPEYIEKVENQNLHAIGEPAMVIVTPNDFAAPSEELAAFHRTLNGISVSVVRLPQIYNEFGSGKPDISAIRDFMRMLYERAGSDPNLMPKYMLLMGDGSFDPKGRVANSNNFVPTYQSIESYSQLSTYTSDDFYVLLDPNEGGNISQAGEDLDVSIGRLPVGSVQEAWDVVNKIKRYKQPQADASCIQINNNNSWRNTVTFVADDEDANTHIRSSDELAEDARVKYPAYNYEKIYLDAFKQVPTPAGDRYPDVNTAILNRINAGTLILNWVGHGGETNWAHERIFNMSDIIQMQNDKLPMFITATCEFSRYDLPERTAGEWLLVNGKGGAIGSLTTVRLVYSNANEALNKELFKHLFELYDNRNPTLGELTLLTKNLVVTDINNTRKFTLLGDPALALNYPRYNVVTTEVNNKPISSAVDTFKALSQITVSGQIQDDNGNVMTGFNGVIYPVVYDKVSTLQTLGNDAGSPIRSFKLYRNILFRGKASVTNGSFNFTFIVPKDIDYQYGFGRISYYADNGSNLDAHGYTQTVIIGGAADSFLADGTGPVMRVYMNDERFAFGGMTTPNPILLVKLEDESGINTTGNGIGHDLIGVMNENTQKMVVLNDYYESELDNFRKGEVRYPFSKLPEGRHKLRVKAWDIHNNSSEEYTEFVVASSAKLALKHVYNYPNPFTTRTQFMFEHNRPCEDLKVVVQIYSVSGRLVKSLQQDVTCTGFRNDDIEWDGRDDYGDPIGKGVYVYKLSVRDAQGATAHKFEKLVVLR